jgi:lysophospholipid acyltransferase (LPLAT)-like uncharacterized protein
MARWKYHIIRGSGSHAIIRAWNEMKAELGKGGELILVPDGPRGPNRELKLGGVKLAKETGAYLVPFTFSTSRKKVLRSWDKFLIFYPFSKVIALYGKPISIKSDLSHDELERERERIEGILNELDELAESYLE